MQEQKVRDAIIIEGPYAVGEPPLEVHHLPADYAPLSVERMYHRI